MTSAHRIGRGGVLAAVLAGLLAACMTPLPSAFASVANFSRVSLTAAGSQAGADSSNAHISADGRYVVFETSAQLVSSDHNGTNDVYRRGLFAGGTTELVSVAAGSSGTALDKMPSHTPAISADGRYVVFASQSSDLVTGTAAGPGTYLRDMGTATTAPTTTRVDVRDGQAPGAWNQNNSASQWWYPAISADGSTIAFVSGDPTLPSGGAGNSRRQVFVRDRLTGQIEEASVSSGSLEATRPCMYPTLSGNGRRVAFASTAAIAPTDGNSGLNVFERDRDAATTILVSASDSAASGNGDSSWPAMSRDGNSVAFVSLASNLVAGDTNAVQDVFVRNLVTAATVRVSVGTGGAQAVHFGSYYPSISDNGRYVAFQSADDELATDHKYGVVFVRDLSLNKTSRYGVEVIPVGGSLLPGELQSPPNPAAIDSCTSISGNGRYVLFDSTATDLVTPDNNGADRDVFLFDQFAQTVPTIATPKFSVSSPKKNAYFYASGSVPKNYGTLADPSAKLTISLFFYRKVGSRATKTYRVTLAAGKSAYKVHVKLPSKGTWYVRAYRPADFKYYARYSSYKKFKVR